MPHQCTTCGHAFPDGSTEMLSGCPECGGNAFQFHPPGTDVPEEPPDIDPPETESGMGGRVGRAASTVRDFVSGSEPPPDEVSQTAPWPAEREDAAQAAARGSTGPPPAGDSDEIIVAEDGEEDVAQSSARRDMATSSDLPEGDPPDDDGRIDLTDMDTSSETDIGPDPDRGRVVSEPTGETPDLSELREQLNDQFESIKIVEPGEYELNLMELYDREEYIIALQENGRYVIQMPEQWMDDGPPD